MTFDPHEKHLSARAVEWLRAKTWRILPRYQQPGGLPACWGTMHGPERGLNPPSAIWKKLNKWALKQGLLRWKMHYPMDESFSWTKHMVQVADVRALVRGRTKGATSQRYTANPFGGPVIVEEPRMPTCPECAVILDEELSATQQRWEFPDDWKTRMAVPHVMELVDPKTGDVERVVFDAAVEHEAEDDPDDNGEPLVGQSATFG